MISPLRGYDSVINCFDVSMITDPSHFYWESSLYHRQATLTLCVLNGPMLVLLTTFVEVVVTCKVTVIVTACYIFWVIAPDIVTLPLPTEGWSSTQCTARRDPCIRLSHPSLVMSGKWRRLTLCDFFHHTTTIQDGASCIVKYVNILLDFA